MEIESIKKKLPQFIKKYKYAALILLIGLALMLLPTGNDKKENTAIPSESTIQQPSIEDKLEQILSKIDGAGEVKVMLTEAEGERFIYQTDQDISSSENSNSESNKTVTVSNAQKCEEGLVVQVEPPVYLGAVVVSQGANKPSVKLALVEAVAKVTGLGANQITVLKMK